jgi:hypothetical protein
MKEELSSSKTSVLTRATRRNIQEDAIIQNYFSSLKWKLAHITMKLFREYSGFFHIKTWSGRTHRNPKCTKVFVMNLHGTVLRLSSIPHSNLKTFPPFELGLIWRYNTVDCVHLCRVKSTRIVSNFFVTAGCSVRVLTVRVYFTKLSASILHSVRWWQKNYEFVRMWKQKIVVWSNCISTYLQRLTYTNSYPQESRYHDWSADWTHPKPFSIISILLWCVRCESKYTAIPVTGCEGPYVCFVSGMIIT